MTVDVNQLFDMLSWDSNEDTQLEGLEEAAKVKYLSIFIRPSEGKGLWENCAKALAGKTDEELEPYLISLFEWLADGNWPGFIIIYERLIKIPAKKILNAYQFSIKRAREMPEVDSKRWLTYLAGLITNQELLELLPLDQQKLMKKYYKRWWKSQEE
ncbi:MAG: DUF5071 domain-containing protein [Clostridia bacterium]|nr:DUF5071 domain-containing protein [Clostridia bacterium]